MYEFEIYNKETKEYNFIFGYNEKDAWNRCSNFNKNEWSIISAEYID